MKGRWTQSPNGGNMLGGAVTLAVRKVILGVFGLIGDHEGVASDLCHDGGGRDAGDPGVSLDDAKLPGVGTNGVSVNENLVWNKPRIVDSLGHGHPEAGCHPKTIYCLVVNVRNANCHRNVFDGRGKPLP